MNVENLRSFIGSLEGGNTLQKAEIEAEYYQGAEEWLLIRIKEMVINSHITGDEVKMNLRDMLGEYEQGFIRDHGITSISTEEMKRKWLFERHSEWFRGRGYWFKEFDWKNLEFVMCV